MGGGPGGEMRKRLREMDGDGGADEIDGAEQPHAALENVAGVADEGAEIRLSRREIANHLGEADDRMERRA